jgi:transposase-like protein
MGNGTFDGKRARARELYDEGYSCNAIAKQLDCLPSTVSRWASAEGLTFDRSQTTLAVRAHTVDLAEARMVLAQKLMEKASDALARWSSRTRCSTSAARTTLTPSTNWSRGAAPGAHPVPV